MATVGRGTAATLESGRDGPTYLTAARASTGSRQRSFEHGMQQAGLGIPRKVLLGVGAGAEAHLLAIEAIHQGCRGIGELAWFIAREYPEGAVREKSRDIADRGCNHRFSRSQVVANFPGPTSPVGD